MFSAHKCTFFVVENFQGEQSPIWVDQGDLKQQTFFRGYEEKYFRRVQF